MCPIGCGHIANKMIDCNREIDVKMNQEHEMKIEMENSTENLCGVSYCVCGVNMNWIYKEYVQCVACMNYEVCWKADNDCVERLRTEHKLVPSTYISRSRSAASIFGQFLNISQSLAKLSGIFV